MLRLHNWMMKKLIWVICKSKIAKMVVILQTPTQQMTRLSSSWRNLKSIHLCLKDPPKSPNFTSLMNLCLQNYRKKWIKCQGQTEMKLLFTKEALTLTRIHPSMSSVTFRFFHQKYRVFVLIIGINEEIMRCLTIGGQKMIGCKWLSPKREPTTNWSQIRRSRWW